MDSSMGSKDLKMLLGELNGLTSVLNRSENSESHDRRPHNII